MTATQSVLNFRSKNPTKLAFGTSGLRGLVTDITDLEAYINSVGFLEYAKAIGDTKPGDVVYIGGDLRPSTHSADRSIMCAVQQAIVDCGLVPKNCGQVPTPALTFYALQQRAVSIMITGSHIPFDRNGIKFNKSTGEVLKDDEAGILAHVERVRRLEYERSSTESKFDDDGWFRVGQRPTLVAADDACATLYRQRYLSFVGDKALTGLVVVFYQHSAVGRDLIPQILRSLGAVVYTPKEFRSDTFIPIDTEAMSAARLNDLQAIADSSRAVLGHIDAIVSTDGDSDRPLVAGVDAKTGRVTFFGGDLLGVVVADWLAATTVAVPISSNDAVDLFLAQRGIVATKTKIGSPYVVKAMMDAAVANPSPSNFIVGWEANGGFLTGSTITRTVNGVATTLAPLPTRDATLPIIACLASAATRHVPLGALFGALPNRFSKADLIDNFAPSSSKALIALFAPPRDGVHDLRFDASTSNDTQHLRNIFAESFTATHGFDHVIRVNWVDGVRIFFNNGDIVHIRASGNAPQLRCYSVANTQERCDSIVSLCIAEPNGLFRQFEARSKTSKN